MSTRWVDRSHIDVGARVVLSSSGRCLATQMGLRDALAAPCGVVTIVTAHGYYVWWRRDSKAPVEIEKYPGAFWISELQLALGPELLEE